METDSTIRKKDFVEMKYTGYTINGMFDSNIEEDLKKIDEKAKPKQTIIIVGEGMIVEGLDKAIEGKIIGKEYEVKVPIKEGFGERKTDLVKTIPLKIFIEKKIMPRPGMVLAMDDSLAKVIAVSGARVVTDFNNPLAGKELNYKFKIVRKVTEEKEKVDTVLGLLLRFVPEYVIDKEVTVKAPKILESYINSIKDKFKELVGKEIKFEEKKVEKKEKPVDKKD